MRGVHPQGPGLTRVCSRQGQPETLGLRALSCHGLLFPSGCVQEVHIPFDQSLASTLMVAVAWREAYKVSSWRYGIAHNGHGATRPANAFDPLVSKQSGLLVNGSAAVTKCTGAHRTTGGRKVSHDDHDTDSRPM